LSEINRWQLDWEPHETLVKFKANDRTLWKKAFGKTKVPYKIEIWICQKCKAQVDAYRKRAGNEANKNNPYYKLSTSDEYSMIRVMGRTIEPTINK
jgi:hypothetical protein